MCRHPGTADHPPDEPQVTVRPPSPNGRSANVCPCGRALRQSSASERSDATRLRCAQILPHNKLPTTPTYCPSKYSPPPPIAQLFFFNNQEKLNKAPCLTHCPHPDHPATGRAAGNCPQARSNATLRTSPQATVRQRSATPGRAEGNRPHASSAPLLLKYPRRLKLCPQKYARTLIIAHLYITFPPPIAHEFSFKYCEMVNKSLSLPARRSPAQTFPLLLHRALRTSHQATVRRRAKQCHPADEPKSIVRMRAPRRRFLNTRGDYSFAL